MLREALEATNWRQAAAKRFDATIRENAERVIAAHRPAMDAMIAKYRARLDGKSVMLYVGGLRPRHVIGAYEDLGMQVTGTGYEFGHADDYQRTAPLVKDGTGTRASRSSRATWTWR
jgi:nitrogenase molybdenum-iron protein alpha chain